MNNRALKWIAVGESFVILGAVLVLVLGWSWVDGLARGLQDRPSKIKGINIHYDYDPQEFFPEAWRTDVIDCGGAQVDLAEAGRVVPLIERFATAYQPEVLQKNLTDIYLLGDLYCYQHPYGGTNSTSAVYLRVGTRAEGYTDRVLLATLHEEFSSILLRNYGFSADTWIRLEGDGFEYPNNSVDLLDEPGLKADPSRDLLEAGFLTLYAASSLENDFNEYAGWIFVWPDRLCDYGSHYPLIRRKAAMVSDFYRSIDPQMETWGCDWDPHPTS